MGRDLKPGFDVRAVYGFEEGSVPSPPPWVGGSKPPTCPHIELPGSSEWVSGVSGGGGAASIGRHSAAAKPDPSTKSAKAQLTPQPGLGR